MPRSDAVHLGVDVGTSGVRGVAIDANGAVVAQASAPLPAPEAIAGGLRQDPELWWAAVTERHPRDRRRRPRAPDRFPGGGRDLGHAAAGRRARARRSSRPACTTTPAPPIWPRASRPPPRPRAARMGRPRPWPGCSCCRSGIRDARYALHQADWIAARLTGRLGVSDDNNALKLGFDPVSRTWPVWLDELGVRRGLLPEVVTPGTPFGPMLSRLAASLGLAPGCMVVAGTTDGCASFLATGAERHRRRRDGARHHADPEAALGPARVRAGARRLQPPDRRTLAGRRRLQQRRQGAAALLHRRAAWPS